MEPDNSVNKAHLDKVGTNKICGNPKNHKKELVKNVSAPKALKNKNSSEQLMEATKKLEIFAEKLFRSNLESRKLRNKLIEFYGNLRVYCRVRPPLPYEKDKALCGFNYDDKCTLKIDIPETDSLQVFNFDAVFPPCSKQEDIFEMVSPLVSSAADGFNIYILAYGQTGTGKTYSLDGIPSQPGVIPRTAEVLFDYIQGAEEVGWLYDIQVSFLEIYQEVLFDSLNSIEKKIDICMSEDEKYEVKVSNITEETVLTAARLRELVKVAKANRANAAKADNQRSHRSHAVAKIKITGRHEKQNQKCEGSLNFVDMACSEPLKSSKYKNETQNDILALVQKQGNITHRNSKLSQLLTPLLADNSKMFMLLNVAPFMDCLDESMNSLRFAACVNSCKLPKARGNRSTNI